MPSNMAGHYLIRVEIASKSRAEFPRTWAEAAPNVLVHLTKEAFQFEQLSRNTNVLHLTQINLATGEISLYSSTQ